MTDDRSLINAILSGNPDAFETIMNRYKNKVFGMIYALTGDKEVTRDLSQEVFVKIYNNLEQFNPYLSLAGWVYRIARNTAFDYLRKNRHVTHFPFDETIENIHGPDAEYGSNEYNEFLADMKKLPIKPLLPPEYIPEGYKYSKAHYYFTENAIVLEGDQLFAANRHDLVIIYGSAKSLISIRQDSNIKKESMLKIPEIDQNGIKENPQILLDDGYKLTKISVGQTEAVKAIKESKETVDIQLILPTKSGDIAIWYNAKTGDYDALSDDAKQKVEQDIIKIAESMMKKEI